MSRFKKIVSAICGVLKSINKIIIHLCIHVFKWKEIIGHNDSDYKQAYNHTAFLGTHNFVKKK